MFPLHQITMLMGSAGSEALSCLAVKLFLKYSNLCEKHTSTSKVDDLLWHNRALQHRAVINNCFPDPCMTVQSRQRFASSSSFWLWILWSANLMGTYVELDRVCLNCYRAMHFSAKRGIAIAYCLSVCPCVTFRYRDHIGWNSSKIISRLISLGSLLLGAPTAAIWFNGNTSNIGMRVKVRIFHLLLIF